MLDFLKNLFGGSALAASYTNLSPNEFGAKIMENMPQAESMTEGVVLDVRTPNEFSSGHLPKAINANVMSSDLITKTAKLDKSKPLFVYCQSGGRSARACKILSDMGFSNIYNMSGGISSWKGRIVR